MTITIDDIRASLIGTATATEGPFGPRLMIYADYAASGRALAMVEDAVRDHLLPVYGNTHTETSFCGRQTTRLRESARDTIRRAVNADVGHAVLFAGNGATGAVDRLVRGQHSAGRLSDAVVFIGPYEHHSNDLPWRESGAEVRRIGQDSQGHPDLAELEQLLSEVAPGRTIFGAFSAASNVTGVLTDLAATARLIHRFGGWFCCDFAAAGPYVSVDMIGGAGDAAERIDAAVFSPHKFPGGPGASGVLIVDRRLMDGAVPGVAGGGTVSYVTATSHHYVRDVERREEAGTPNILADLRAGLVFHIKDEIGAETIANRDAVLVERLEQGLSQVPGIQMLRQKDVPSIGIFPFNVMAKNGVMLHHNYVVALLNDLFGIQVRGGCSCAGPYAHDLLGLDAVATARHERAVLNGLGLLRPGWVRLSVNYFFTEDEIDYIRDAIAFIADRGADLLSRYDVDLASGIWRARDYATSAGPTLSTILSGHSPEPLPDVPDFAGALKLAEKLADDARSADSEPISLPLPIEHEGLSWFASPRQSIGQSRSSV